MRVWVHLVGHAACVRSLRTACNNNNNNKLLVSTDPENRTRNWFGWNASLGVAFRAGTTAQVVCSSTFSAYELIWLSGRVPAPEALLWRPMRHNALALRTHSGLACESVSVCAMDVCLCLHAAWASGHRGWACMCAYLCSCVVFAWRYAAHCVCFFLVTSLTIVSLQSHNPGSENQSLRKICRMRSTILIHTELRTTTTTTKQKYRRQK